MVSFLQPVSDIRGRHWKNDTNMGVSGGASLNNLSQLMGQAATVCENMFFLIFSVFVNVIFFHTFSYLNINYNIWPVWASVHHSR